MKETTAARLKQIMSERRLRQVDIIHMCEPYCQKYNLKLTKSDLSQFVSGKVVPSQWKISILSHALDISEAWLMGFDVPQRRDPDASDEQLKTIAKLNQLTPENRIRFDAFLDGLLAGQEKPEA